VVVPVATVSAVSAPAATQNVAVPVFRAWTRLAMADGPQAAVIKGVFVMRCFLYILLLVNAMATEYVPVEETRLCGA
jgi:hypothetical protein